MSSHGTISIRTAFVLLTFSTFYRLTAASLSLQELQPIANFPADCQGAYQQRVQGCPDASSFSLIRTSSGGPICTKECFNALQRATANIQANCQGTSAPPGTVIAHAFAGDLSAWLCDLNDGANSQSTPTSNSATNAASSPPSSASQSASSSLGTSSQSLSQQTSTTASNSVSPTSSSIVSSSVSNSSPSSTTASPTKSSTQTLSSATLSTSTKGSSSSSSSTSSSRATATINNGSPFDQVVPNTGSHLLPNTHQSIVSLLISITFAIILAAT